MARPWLFSELPGQFTWLFFLAVVGAVVEVGFGAVVEGAAVEVVGGLVVVLLVPEPVPEPVPVPV